ncbi:MAG: VOC family protein [Candidatus Limnocylindrales bacterium]
MDFPATTEGFVLTHFLVVADQDRSRAFYRALFDGQVLMERDPIIMKVANSWLIMAERSAPTSATLTAT